MNKYDKQYQQLSDRAAKEIDEIFSALIAELSALLGVTEVVVTERFLFKNHPSINKKVNELINEASKKIITTIQSSTTQVWSISNTKKDSLVASVFKDKGIEIPKLYSERNAEALKAFQIRKTKGLKVSDRVWRYSEGLKSELEKAIDIAITEGQSAAELGRSIKKYLNEPDKLFRKVRDKHKNLVLSKNAMQYHPGQGVYRSSTQNALRLARNEINKAYRLADHLRWEQMDFVVGYEIVPTSRSLTGACSICEALRGIYPKDFVFTGFHVSCRCVCVPKLCSIDQFIDLQTAIISGGRIPSFSKPELPNNFTSWFEKVKPKLKKGNLPDWYADNLTFFK